MSLWCFPSGFRSIQLTVWEKMFEEFQDSRHGGHLVYSNGMILAILALCRSDASHQVFAQSDLRFERRWPWRISRWLPLGSSWISEQNNFINSESLCHSDASHQVSAQSDLWFGRSCHLKHFKMATIAAILDIRREWFYQFWISVLLRCSHQVSVQSHLRFVRRCCLKNF